MRGSWRACTAGPLWSILPDSEQISIIPAASLAHNERAPRQTGGRPRGFPCQGLLMSLAYSIGEWPTTSARICCLRFALSVQSKCKQQECLSSIPFASSPSTRITSGADDASKRPWDATCLRMESMPKAGRSQIIPRARASSLPGRSKGKSIGGLRKSHGEELLGRHHPCDVFPLLLKYLDAHQHLSLQVHPDDQCAAALGLTDPGKTEAWYIMEAEPGSCLWAGFAEPVDREVVEQALRQVRDRAIAPPC